MRLSRMMKLGTLPLVAVTLLAAGCSLIVDRQSDAVQGRRRLPASSAATRLCQQRRLRGLGAGPGGLRRRRAAEPVRLPQRLLDGGLRAVRQLRAPRPLRPAGDAAADGRSDQRRHPAAGQPGDHADAALLSAGGRNIIYMYGTVRLRADAARRRSRCCRRGTPPYRAIYLNATSCAGRHLGLRLRPSASSSTRRPARRPTTPSTSTTTAMQMNCLLDTGGNTVDIGVSEPLLRHLQHLDRELRLGDDGQRLHRPGGPLRHVGAVGARRRSPSAPRRRTWSSASAARAAAPAASRTPRRGPTRPTTSSATATPARRC